MSHNSDVDCDSLLKSDNSSESSFPCIVNNLSNVIVTMETYPILNDQDDTPCFSILRDGYLVIQGRDLRECPNLENQLKYPKGIDPFRINGQIIFLSILIVLICALFGSSFAYIFIPIKYIEFGICAIVCVQFIILIFYYSLSVSWCNFLSNSGYYRFPQKIIGKRTMVLFFWGVGAFLLSPVLLIIKLFCDSDTQCGVKLYNYKLMQLYILLESLLIVFGLIWHLAVVVKFKMQRRWPDIWHERLLEESAIINWCPLIKLSELRIDSADDQITAEHDRVQGPRAEDIMQSQAYVITYLRNLNSNLAIRISGQSREPMSDLVTRVEVDQVRESRHEPMDSLSLVSSSNLPSMRSNNAQHNSFLS